MMAFLHWLRDVVVGMLNGVVKFALFIVALFILFAFIGMIEGDGLPGNMVLALDLRSPMQDSAPPSPFGLSRPLTVMDVVLGLDAAAHDARVKGVYMRVGSADLSVAQAEEIGAALKRFRASGKFVIAHSQGFLSPGIGDYLTAANADQIWMQPNSPFSAAGSGAGAIFLRGLFDKIQAEPQIVKRADYKSAADMFMEKDYTAPDREQMTALLTSFYNDGTAAAAEDRKIDQKSVQATFEASPQSAESAMKAGLIDKTGYDDDAYAVALARAGEGARGENFATFIRAADERAAYNHTGNIALIEASGDIVDGTAGGGVFGGNVGIAGDDLSRAIRTATKDRTIKAILLRVDSPGGSVTASDQILDAVKKAQAAGKPVVISMGSVAASGGYYISCAAAKIVAEPATITGSIGVLTGKVSFGKSLNLIGVTADQIGVGKNALIDSAISPFTPEQLAAINAQADEIYADFMQKVAAGRKIPLAQVQNIAKGRVWSGTDAKARGLVDQLGGFWVAAADAAKLAGDPADARIAFRRYPQRKGFFEAVGSMFSGSSASLRAMQGMVTLFNSPIARAMVQAADETPRGDVELRATNLPAQ
ncbi:MAG TPA: signal peptide peptidase SppA [Rhizomicrobium sp.]|nr:signal peptide peptidase SppA [Rhizomicrobium sp.]